MPSEVDGHVPVPVQARGGTCRAHSLHDLAGKPRRKVPDRLWTVKSRLGMAGTHSLTLVATWDKLPVVLIRSDREPSLSGDEHRPVLRIRRALL